MKLSNYGQFHDHFFFTEDEARLYPAFGREKVVQQSRLRQIHRGESAAQTQVNNMGVRQRNAQRAE